MPDLRPPSSFALWLDEALTGWILPVGGLALLGIAGALYAMGYVTEGFAAGVLAILAGVLAAAYVLKPALSRRTDPLARTLSIAAAIGTLFLAAFPALETVVPGTPLAEGTLGGRGDAMTLPPGMPAFARLLVSTTLPPGGTPRVQFALSGGRGSVEGALERTTSYARVGRGGRAAVSHDHSSIFVPARLSGATALVLERRSGDATGPLAVQVYRDLVPPFLHWALAAIFIVLAAAAEARTRDRKTAAVAAMAIAFGLIVTDNATPTAAVGASMGALVVGALGGAIAGALVALVVKRIVPEAPEAAPAGGGKAKPGPRGAKSA